MPVTLGFSLIRLIEQNRMGTSVDDGMQKSNNWLDQWQNWAPEVEFSPFHALSCRQLTFPFCCYISLIYSCHDIESEESDLSGRFKTQGTTASYSTGPGGGGTWVFFGWVCAARDSKLAPRSKKLSAKIDTPF